MPINRLAYTKTPASPPASEGMLPASNPSNYGNATTKVINLNNNNWLSDSVVFTVDSAWRYVVHVRNTKNGASSIHIDDVRVYGMNTATYLACDTAGGGYRWGFGSHEKLDEISGSGYTIDMGDRWLDVRLGRTFKMDIHAFKYPHVNPYIYALDNPLVFIDPDGKDVIIHGADASKAVAALQTKTNLDLALDIETGKLVATGMPKTKLDFELMDAVSSQTIRVNLYTTQKDYYISRDGSTQPITIGGYDGSVVKTEKVGDKEVKIVETTQYINMNHAEKAENAGISNQGSDVFHEVIESYYGAQDAPGEIYNSKKWSISHQRAHEADPEAIYLLPAYNLSTKEAGLKRVYSPLLINGHTPGVRPSSFSIEIKNYTKEVMLRPMTETEVRLKIKDKR